MPSNGGNRLTKRLGAKAGFLQSLVWIGLIASVILIWSRLAATGMRYEWHWNRLWTHFGHFGAEGFVAGPLLKGIGMTIGIAGLGLCFSFITGLAAAVMRLGPWPFCNFLSRLYIGLWRNTPLLIQLFFAYFVLSPIFDTGPFWTAVLALAAFEGAYMAEVLRAGLLSVPRGQWEASLSLGLNIFQTLRSVILPQACANTWPALTNQAISILKDTSLVSAIAVADLTMQSQALVAETFLAFEVWLIAGGCYLLMALCISLPSLWWERQNNWR